MQRIFLASPIEPQQKLLIHDKAIVHKIKNVLRLKPKQHIIVFDTNNKEYTAAIEEISDSITLSDIQPHQNNTEPRQHLILYPSLFKKNRFEWMLEKCTEIGVSAFVPVISKHSVVHTEKTPERWRNIITEAAQQSGRTMVPAIGDPISAEQALSNISSGTVIVAVEGNDTTHIFNGHEQEPLHLFIGPEGGWDSSELELFRTHNARFATLGKRVLRAETASIVFSAFYIYAEGVQQQ